MKVYVVWDPICERVISVHKTKEGAWKGMEKADKEAGRDSEGIHLHEYDEFELED